MSSITPHYRTVTQLLQNRSFSIDEYQREYKWSQQNIEELVTDLQGKFDSAYRAGDSPKAASEYPDYFLGSIIVTKRAGKNFLVDGQQRVTSLTLFLIFLYREAKMRKLAVASTIEPLIFSDNYGERQFNLDVTERVPVIRALFGGEDYNSDGKEESVQNILDRYRDIESIGLVEGLGEGLESFIYWLLNNVGLIEIATDTDAHAYSIFETMNDRGKPLSPVDMLKAYLLGSISDTAQRTSANGRWKKTVSELISWAAEPNAERDANFVKAWLRSQYAETIRDRKAGATDMDWELIGTAFHRWIRDNSNDVGVGSSAENYRLMTESFPFFARAYLKILDASKNYTPGLESIFFNAYNDFTWQSTVLLASLDPVDDDDTVERKLAATATYLDIWIMRRTVNYVRVGYSAVSYAMWILCKDIRRKQIGELVDILVGKLGGDDVSFDGSESRGRGGVTDLRLNQFSRRYIYHFLARLTAYTDVESGKPDIFDKYVDRKQKNAFDIEHIWADKYRRYADQCANEQDFEILRNNVGGLVLLPADVNRSYQDRTFEQKSPHYAKQNLYAASLTKAAYQHQPQFKNFIQREGLDFKSYDDFGVTEQAERRTLVLELAKRVWSVERLSAFRI